MASYKLTRKSKKCLEISVGLCTLVIIWGTHLWRSDTGELRPRLDNYVPLARKIFSPITNEYPLLNLPGNYPKNRVLDLKYLERLVQTPRFTYSRRVIRTQHYSGKRPELTRVNDVLTPPAIILDTQNLSAVAVPQISPLILRIPHSPNVDTSIFSFGMATTLPRLDDSISGISHWLPNSHAQLHLLIPSNLSLTSIQTQLRKNYMNVTITADSTPFQRRYFSLIKTLYENRTPNTKWLVLCDDDTFFPSLSSLAAHFTATYNAEIPIIVGALTDDLEIIYTYGLSIAGGGGIFLSVPLAAQLLQPSTWQSCIKKENKEGDELLNDCLNEFTDIKPTFDPLLHQMDIYSADGSTPEAGYFESGKKMLSVHHWKSWFHYNVSAGSLVGRASDGEGIWMRWLFDEGVVLANGYSVVHYKRNGNGCVREGCQNYSHSDGRLEEELGKVEYTWNEGDEEERWRYVHMMGPLRGSRSSEMKRSAKLVDASVVEGAEGRGVRQIYVETVEDKGKFENFIGWEKEERVVELFWLI